MHFDRQPFSRAAFPEQQLLFDAFSGATNYCRGSFFNTTEILFIHSNDSHND